MSATPEWEDIPRSQLVRDMVKRDRENPRANANWSPPSSGNSSLDAASDGARSYAKVPIEKPARKPYVVWRSGVKMYIPYPRRSSGESSSVAIPKKKVQTTENGPVSLKKQKPAVDWFTLLSSDIPCSMPGRLRLIQTFDAFHSGKDVKPTSKQDGPWSDLFCDLVFIACEVFLPYMPYGGPGCSTAIAMFGPEKMPRNSTIAAIMRLAIPGKPFDKKTISSHMQTVVKRLLARYNDQALSRELRDKAGLALKNLAQEYPLETFYSSYVTTTESAPPKIKIQSNQLIRDDTLRVAEYVPPNYEIGKAPALHPIVAFFVNMNGRHLNEAPLLFVDCSAPHQVPTDAPTHAQTWWNEVVMVDSPNKTGLARNGSNNNGRIERDATTSGDELSE